MANLNAGTQVRFNNGGIILIGADTLLNVVAGSLSFKVPGYAPIPTMDRGVIGAVVAGDERPVEGTLELKYTSPTDSDGVLAAVAGALVATKISNRTAAGKVFTFSMTVKIPDYAGAVTGDQYVFVNCYLENPLDFQSSSGEDIDTLKLNFKDAELSPAITRY